MESLAAATGPIDELELRRVHGLVLNGKATPSAYRSGQSVIRHAATGGIVYMPPEADDVPELMNELFEWLNAQLSSHELPVPLVAAITHYQRFMQKP